MNFEINININLDARQSCFILAVRHGQDLTVQLEASSLNDVLMLFATHYHQVDEIYEIAEVS